MLSANQKKFEHRIRTIIGLLRNVHVDKNPADAYGQLHTIERSIQQAKMFIIKDLGDRLASSCTQKEREIAISQLYDCLGFHRDEIPAKDSST